MGGKNWTMREMSATEYKWVNDNGFNYTVCWGEKGERLSNGEANKVENIRRGRGNAWIERRDDGNGPQQKSKQTFFDFLVV